MRRMRRVIHISTPTPILNFDWRTLMPLKVRRVVTGHDANGKAVIASDEVLTAVPRRAGSDITGCEIWSTDRMPVDNSREADAAQRKGFVVRHNYVGSGQGTTCRITEFAPGHGPFPHRT